MIHPFAAVAVLALSTLMAQSVEVTMTALTPLTIRASDGTQTATNSWPAGPLSGFGSTCTSLPPSGAGGCIWWQSFARSSGALANLRYDLGNQTLQPNFTCQAGPHEILVEFSSATARTAQLHLARAAFLAPGAPWATVQVDINNDGVIEIANLSTISGQPIAVSFGPQSLQVRIVIDATLGSQAASSNNISLSLLPDNDLTITKPIRGCNPVSPPPPPFLYTSFDHTGVGMLYGDPNQLSVMVLGLTTQPTLLAINGALPCILLPQPDVVLFVPSGIYNLPLPASLRPATFYAQGVTLAPSGLQVTDGYAVTAN